MGAAKNGAAVSHYQPDCFDPILRSDRDVSRRVMRLCMESIDPQGRLSKGLVGHSGKDFFDGKGI